jgi:hypothetical protein
MEWTLVVVLAAGGGDKHHLVLPWCCWAPCANREGPFCFCARVPMGDDDDDEIHLHVTYASHFDMDEAFCARMRMAIAAGLETAPIGVVTSPGTKNPKYVATKQVARFSQGSDL